MDKKFVMWSSFSSWEQVSVRVGHREPSWLVGRQGFSGAERLSVRQLLVQWREALGARLEASKPLVRPGLRLLLAGGFLLFWGQAGPTLTEVSDARRGSLVEGGWPSISVRGVLPSVGTDGALSPWKGEQWSRRRASRHRRKGAPKGASGVSMRKQGPRAGAGQVAPKAALLRGARGGPRSIFLLSWDGAKSSVLQEMMKGGVLPGLRGLWRGGKGTLQARTVVPSLTLPSHASMLTGVTVKQHKMRWNSYQASRGRIGFPTLLDLVSKAQKRAGFFVTKRKLMHLVRPAHQFYVYRRPHRAGRMMKAMLRYYKKHPMELVFVHFLDPDYAGHKAGWGNRKKQPVVEPSSRYRRALKRCDRALQRLVAFLHKEKLWAQSLILVTSDHGGHDRTHGTKRKEDMQIPWILGGGWLSKDCEVRTPVRTLDTTPTLLAAWGLSIPPWIKGRPRLRCR